MNCPECGSLCLPTDRLGHVFCPTCWDTVSAEQPAPEPKPVRRSASAPKQALLKGPSDLEAMFEAILLLDPRIPSPARQFPWLEGRKYRADFAWCFTRIASKYTRSIQLERRYVYQKLWRKEARVIVEVQGMAHRIRGRFQGDTRKVNEAQLAGWKILLFCGEDIRHNPGYVLATVQMALGLSCGV